MASSIPLRKNNFTAIGVAGRKTGIVIEDTGERNEHGFERMDAFFSPTTTPGRTVGERTPNGRGYESDIGDETDVRATDASAPMDIASSGADVNTALHDIRHSSPVRPPPGRAGSLGPRASLGLTTPKRYSMGRPSFGSDSFLAREPSRSASPPKRPITARGISPFRPSVSPFSVKKTSLPPAQPSRRGISLQQKRIPNPTASRQDSDDRRPLPDIESESEETRRPSPQTPPKKAPTIRPLSPEVPSSPAEAPAKLPSKPSKLLSLSRPRPAAEALSDEEVIPENDEGDEEEMVPAVIPKAKASTKGKLTSKPSLPPTKAKDTSKRKARVPMIEESEQEEDEEPELPLPKPISSNRARTPAKYRGPSPEISDVSYPLDAEAEEDPESDAEEAEVQRKTVSRRGQTKPTANGSKVVTKKTKAPSPELADEVVEESEPEIAPATSQKASKTNKNSVKPASKVTKPGKKTAKQTTIIQAESEEEIEEVEENVPRKKGTSKTKTTQSNKARRAAEEEGDEEDEEEEEEGEEEERPSKERPIATKKTAAKAKASASKKTAAEPERTTSEENLAPPTPQRKASQTGKKYNSKKTTAEEEESQPSKAKAPTKQTKSTAKKASTTEKPAAKATKTSKGKRKSPELEAVPEDEEAVPQSSQAVKKRKISSTKENSQAEKSTAAPRAIIQTVRRETPALPEPSEEELGKRRSGRARYAPLKFWANERPIYKASQRRTSTGKVIIQPEIDAIIRIESPPPPPKKKKGAATTNTKPKKRKRDAEISEDESWDLDDLDDWEKEDGVFEGMVRSYPPGEDEELISEELAISPERIEPQTVANGNFALCKTVSKDFIGTGMIDLPSGGEKRTKNSGKMHIIMYVVTGRVEVNIGDNTFRMRKGGQFSIPRGNLYSIANHWDRPARLFFAQGWDTALSQQMEN